MLNSKTTKMSTNLVIGLALFIVFLIPFFLKKKSPAQPSFYAGKAKLIARFTDEQGCFLCQFEQNGKIVNAVYGDDRPELKVGDEVDIVWNGMYTKFPHVMDKQVYERDMDMIVQSLNDQNKTL